MGTHHSPPLHSNTPSTTAAANNYRTTTVDAPPNHLSKPQIKGQKMTKKSKHKPPDDSPSSSSSSSIISPKDRIFNHNRSLQRGIRVSNKRRNPRFCVRRSATDVEAIAFPLGMSIAAVLAQILERKDLVNENTSFDHLSMVCTSAVRESLFNVFGDKFDGFVRNFENSFGSTLSTLRLIRNSPMNHGEDQVDHNHFESLRSTTPKTPLSKGESSLRICDAAESFTESIKHTHEKKERSERVEEAENDWPTDSRNQGLLIQSYTHQQLASTASSMQTYSGNFSALSLVEKSVHEQTRANDLKNVEIGLTLRKLQMKETQLALNSDSNLLERCKLSLGISRSSFKNEKFKSQLEETRHSELLRTCADFLVADILIMLCCLCYGVYAFSYDKIHQLTSSCAPAESKSWWIPKPMASINSGLQSINCQVQIYSRMLFGILMVLAIVYVLIQRSSFVTQGMPITFILLLLGVVCGFAGKLCVDTLGGNGYQWLIYWEVLCLLHFFANVFTPYLFYILNGAIKLSQDAKSRSVFPYWSRRWLFYLILLFLPVCCGLLPFASPRTWWEEHFSTLIRNHLLAAHDEL